MDTLTLRIQPASVYFLRFVLEGYDNLFVLSTLDPNRGVVEIRIAQGAENDLQRILSSLAGVLGLDHLTAPRGLRTQ